MVKKEKTKLLERMRAHDQMRFANQKRKAAHTDLEKHYGVYVDSNDDIDFEVQTDMEELEKIKDEEDWKKFSIRHLKDEDKQKNSEVNNQWLACFSNMMLYNDAIDDGKEIARKYQDSLYEELREEYENLVDSVGSSLCHQFAVPPASQTFYKDENGESCFTPEHVTAINQTVAQRLLFLAEQYVEKNDTRFPGVHYLQQIDSDKKPQQLDKPIDKSEVRLYGALFDALKIAKINLAHTKEDAKKIAELGKRFLTKEDQKHLQKIKPLYVNENLQLLLKDAKQK